MLRIMILSTMTRLMNLTKTNSYMNDDIDNMKDFLGIFPFDVPPKIEEIKFVSYEAWLNEMYHTNSDDSVMIFDFLHSIAPVITGEIDGKTVTLVECGIDEYPDRRIIDVFYADSAYSRIGSIATRIEYTNDTRVHGLIMLFYNTLNDAETKRSILDTWKGHVERSKLLC